MSYGHISSTLWLLDFFNTIRVSNSLDPDQAQHFVRPDLGPNCLQGLSVWLDLGSNCLQRLSADNKSGQKVKYKKTC